MSHSNDIQDLKDDALVLAQAQAGRDYSDKLLKWVIGLLLSALIAGGSLYGKWISDSIRTDQQSISKVVQQDLRRDENLDILNSKIDVILNYHGLRYNGPDYKRSTDQVKQNPE